MSCRSDSRVCWHGLFLYKLNHYTLVKNGRYPPTSHDFLTIHEGHGPRRLPRQGSLRRTSSRVDKGRRRPLKTKRDVLNYMGCSKVLRSHMAVCSSNRDYKLKKLHPHRHVHRHGPTREMTGYRSDVSVHTDTFTDTDRHEKRLTIGVRCGWEYPHDKCLAIGVRCG